ncbi:hypothetical protein EON81_05745, partial [bacterium]
AQTVTPGYTKIRRIWRAGDRVTLGFDMRAKTFSQEGQIALQRGPMVLALDSRLTPAARRQVTLNRSLELKPNPDAAKAIGAWMAFDLDGLTFCDYASAGNGFRQTNTFRTWLPQPLNLATVYQTGQTWQSMSHSGNWTDPPKPRSQVENRQKDLALAANGARAFSSSEFDREPGSTNESIDGFIATPEDFTNRWHSSIEGPHPHWIEIRLAKPTNISRVVLHFADPAGYPVRFEGTVRVGGENRRVIDVTGNRQSRVYSAKFEPVTTDTFRLTIHSSANPAYPNAAQISEIEIYR